MEEPTLILLFGDHQPQVATNFYTDVLGTAPDTALAQKKQMVPFVLWANYDIPEAQGVELSLNYLSALLMDTANLPMTGYQKYLARLWEAAPVINTVGIRDAAGTGTARTRRCRRSWRPPWRTTGCCSTTMYLTRKPGGGVFTLTE